MELEGLSDAKWRERIGNAVPPDAAQAMAETMGHTLLLAWSGTGFILSNLPIWVQPVAVALSVKQPGELPGDHDPEGGRDMTRDVHLDHAEDGGFTVRVLSGMRGTAPVPSNGVTKPSPAPRRGIGSARPARISSAGIPSWVR